MAERRSAKQAHEARSQHRDSWLIVFVVGLAIIVFGNLLGIGPWWLATAVSIVMVGFAYAIRESTVSGDAKGDSIYYLGLLFTFVALVAALISFDWGTPDTDASGTSGAIRNFGIALLTTIVGLAGRVWFTMSHESPGDVAETAKLALEHAVSEMERSLNRARDDLDTLANKFRESAVELGRTTGAIAASTEKAARTVSSLDNFAEGVAGLATSFTNEMESFVPIVREGSTSVDTFVTSLEGIETKVNNLGDYVKEAGVQLHLAFSDMSEEARASADAVPGFRKGLQDAASKVAALNTTLAELESGADNATKAFGRMGENVDGTHLGQVLVEAAQQARTMRESFGSIGDRTTILDDELNNFGQAAISTQRSLIGLSSTSGLVDAELSEVGNDLSGQVAGIRVHTEKLNKNLAALRDETAESTKTLDGLRGQMRGLEQDIAETRQQRLAGKPLNEPFAELSRATPRSARGAIHFVRQLFRRSS